jgi:hypothetical protein
VVQACLSFLKLKPSRITSQRDIGSFLIIQNGDIPQAIASTLLIA